jgi:hypothetical protein
MSCVPCDCHVHSAIESLFPIMDGRLGFSDVGPDPTIVVSDLLVVFDEPTVELDHIRILDSVRMRRHVRRYYAPTFSLNWLAVPSMQTTRFRPDVGHEQLGCSGFALDVSGSLVVGKSSDSTCTSGRILALSGLRFASVDDPGCGLECAGGIVDSKAGMNVAQWVPSRRSRTARSPRGRRYK